MLIVDNKFPVDLLVSDKLINSPVFMVNGKHMLLVRAKIVR